jgi:hypothetical protein
MGCRESLSLQVYGLANFTQDKLGAYVADLQGRAVPAVENMEETLAAGGVAGPPTEI